jgi:hypothetical protein
MQAAARKTLMMNIFARYNLRRSGLLEKNEKKESLKVG